MGQFSVSEATKFFRTYGLKCNEELVQEWLDNTESISSQVCEDDFYHFNDWYRWKGTAYEEGIDDQTKIARLVNEIKELRSEIALLKKQRDDSNRQEGDMPF